MKTERMKVTRIILFPDDLDPISVYPLDYGNGSGCITFTCYGKAWTAYWSAMGDVSLTEFVCTAEPHYLAGKLSSENECEIDWERVSRTIGEEVDITTAYYLSDKLEEAFGQDWRLDLPTRQTNDFTYLLRIVEAVQEGLRV